MKHQLLIALLITACGGGGDDPAGPDAGSLDAGVADPDAGGQAPDGAVANCGDLTCSGQESCGSCPSDCACDCSAGAGDCTGAQDACIEGSCANAFGRSWRIVVLDGLMPTLNGQGQEWDEPPLGESPDPFVLVELDGVPVANTSTVADAYFPSWNEYVELELAPGSRLRFSVQDEDIEGAELMFSCSFDPIAAEVLDSGSGSAACDFGDHFLQISFEQPPSTK